MAGKLRPLYPDFWTDDDVVELPPLGRLLFQGLWTFACDNGHLEDRSRQLKRRILPEDDVNVADLLREIADHGLIHREDGWITVLAAPRRWKTDSRWFKTCNYPGCVKPKRETRRGHRVATAGTRGGHAAEVEGEVEVNAAAAADAAAAARLDPVLDVLRSKLQAHTRLQALRFDTLGPEQTRLLLGLIEKHGDDRLVKVALDTCKATPPVHVSAFLGTWEALPAPGVRLAAVEQRFCRTHDWITLTSAGVCSACASEAIEAKTGETR